MRSDGAGRVRVGVAERLFRLHHRADGDGVVQRADLELVVKRRLACTERKLKSVDPGEGRSGNKGVDERTSPAPVSKKSNDNALSPIASRFDGSCCCQSHQARSRLASAERQLSRQTSGRRGCRGGGTHGAARRSDRQAKKRRCSFLQTFDTDWSVRDTLDREWKAV